MKVLYGKTFGIGNAVMALPAIKALGSMGHEVDVLVGTLPDDAGAYEVMRAAQRNMKAPISCVFANSAMIHYDLAIMAIPFDGRWQNGQHFSAKGVIDGRTRPDPSTTGLVSWKRHEVEYQMDNVRNLGYAGPIPDCSFLPPCKTYPKIVYLGVGYKKDAAGFWKKKHWGNENYAELIKKMLADDPELKIIATGDVQDFQQSLGPIHRLVGNPRFQPMSVPDLIDCFGLLSMCGMYVGNDTGMAHVAAACGLKVITVHNLGENSIAKAHPWCHHADKCDPIDRIELDGSAVPVSVDQLYSAVRELQNAQ